MQDNIDTVDTVKTSRKIGELVKKPQPVLDYNRGMGVFVWVGGWAFVGVDRMDQQLASYLLMHHYLKTNKIFSSLFDMTLFNAYVWYKITSQKLKYNQSRLVIEE
jgi:hypothetical protein